MKEELAASNMIRIASVVLSPTANTLDDASHVLIVTRSLAQYPLYVQAVHVLLSSETGS